MPGGYRPAEPATYGIGVRRGPVVDLAAEVAHAPAAGWETVLPAVVDGHGGYLLSAEIDDRRSFSLLWSPAPGLVLSIGGGRADEVVRIADGLTVGPVPPGPPDAAGARRSVEAAVRACFGAGRPAGACPPAAGGAGEPGGATGGAAGLAVARIAPVVFLSETEAMAGYELRDPTAPAGAPQAGTTVSGVLELVATPSGWRLPTGPRTGGSVPRSAGCEGGSGDHTGPSPLGVP
ncbi:hypothetical protein CcI49_15650 [Frankia sp. CcI49]|uniref:hypothetical protein n=1 Tax=Frankia sp. CcI49 TaxID=1745382 RepID=UPI0009756090|nr:hypothetical protein [Frankia sp. CcI49]ONH59422.1 hypothetical protein CcI49_15650 [Frankia sp. CcI49]